MTPEEELKQLKDLLVQATNELPPCGVGLPHFGNDMKSQDYRKGFTEGWIAYRQKLKRLIFPHTP